MQITFLGTGTSQGVPIIGCRCEVCTSPAAENKRNRPSLWVEVAGRSIIIDTAPELRLQVLRYGPTKLDAVLFTHAHADHIFGFDDIRRFCQTQRTAIPVYAARDTLTVLQSLFSYAFNFRDGDWSIPKAIAHEITGPFEVLGVPVTPLTVYHGYMPVIGFRIAGFAYITDCSSIPTETEAALEDLDVLVLDALRYRFHPTHFNIDTAVATVERLQPRRAFLTHLCHEVEHHTLQQSLPEHIAPAYDGLRFYTPDPPRLSSPAP
ncbi:MAG: MBL fold metallo-hydrolase [Limnochordia bacterium]|jgi:phosphoribosyl 1,2-cyclic phosphate phosphodiesterase